ncbi:MAG: spore germination protein [Clostridiaceae bacterium]|nr:spore germination protein [Clostridiaceae bacterium]
MFGKKNRKPTDKGISGSNTGDEKTNTLKKELIDNINLFRSIFSQDDTLVIRSFQNKYLNEAKCCVIYFDGMVNKETLNEDVILPVLGNNLSEKISKHNLLEELQNKVITSNKVNLETDLSVIIEEVICGNTVFLLDGFDSALIICNKGWHSRTIEEPHAETVVRGPREGFTEALTTNIPLIRRRIKSPKFKIKYLHVGVRTHTKIGICYIDDIVSKDILREVEKRLREIDIDGILDSGYIQELIRDAPYSPFETVGYTERPDVVASKVLEGRVAIIVDGSPFVLTVPFVIGENTQSCEDYYNNYIFSTINRLIRTTSSITSMSIPAIYLAVVTYHQEMVPTRLLLSLSAARQGVAIPTSLSLFLMLLLFDVLKEAGTRMPQAIGQAVNIVGALVLGEAAVEAKLVSAPVVIITALSGILTLLNIKLIGAVIVFRYIFLLLASVIGIYGYIIGFMFLLLHLMSIRSFGVPYLLNVTSVKDQAGNDMWIRAPWWDMTLRPKIIAARNLVRQTTNKRRKR